MLISDCDSEEIIPAANGIYEIRNKITGEYLSLSATSEKVFLSKTHLGCNSQWSMEPENNADGIWGHIKTVTNKKYLAIGNDFECEPESDNRCGDEKVDIRVVDDSTWLGRWPAPIYKKLWRRVGNQLLNKFGSKYIITSVWKYDSFSETGFTGL